MIEFYTKKKSEKKLKKKKLKTALSKMRDLQRAN